MKIGIITQPLYDNYGGLLQNWALQQTLITLGHEPITFDLLIKKFPRKLKFSVAIKNCIKKLMWFRRYQLGNLSPMNRTRFSRSFIEDNIIRTKRIDSYSSDLISEYEVSAIIVGSDQVWRPRYNYFLDDMFLRFCKNSPIRKIAYSASFGVDNWEYTQEQTKSAKKLIRHFNKVSVREDSAINLIRHNLEFEAVQTLDPTLLLDKTNYLDLIKEKNISKNKYIAAYILNPTSEINETLRSFAEITNLELMGFSADSRMAISVGEWLSAISHSDFVITDSFHGMAFSIIFHKDFYVICNEERGCSRFISLLSQLNLCNRIISDAKCLTENTKIDWTAVDEKINILRNNSIEYIQDALK
ncbi:MAG: polysaccharide pyruvyl transferase family protein [Muribaculaceae bacterium]|nr:polysaccharide pyruvyl transferase family protein [Muribaculaceae bacterium]